MKVRKEVKWFAGRMENKLSQNDHKEGWEYCHSNELITSVEDELNELIKKMSEIGYQVFWEHFPDDSDIDQLIDECADIANFAMMIADNANLIKLKKGER
jgi:DNA primase large subunit